MTRPSQLNPLTSLRFFAAFAVFVYHSGVATSTLSPYRLGDVGVGFFFVLSGFIISYVYLDRMKTFNRKTILNFYAARFAKIYPMHLVTFFATVPSMMRSYGIVLGAAIPEIVIIAAICNILLLQAYFPANADIIYSFNNVSWTISIEALFYALFPFVALAIARYRRYLTKNVAIAGMFVSWMAIVCANLFLPSEIYALPFLRLPEFLIGVMGSIWFMHVMSGKTQAVQPSRATLIEAIALISMIVSALAYPMFSGTLSVITFTAPSIAFSILVFALSQGAVSRVLSHRLLVFLGEASFSFYMIHHIILNNVAPDRNIGAVAIALVVTIIGSMLTYLYIEEPARKAVKGYLGKRIDKLA